MRRPFGVTLIALLFGLAGIFAIVIGVTTLNNRSANGSAIAILFVVASVLPFAMGVGLLRLRRWAWILTLLLQVVNAVGLLITLYQGQIPSLGALILNIVIFVYLRQPAVRAAFAA